MHPMHQLLLHDLENLKKPIDVIVCGLGFMGFGFVSGVQKIPNIRIPLIISRRPQETVNFLNSKKLKAMIVDSPDSVLKNTQMGIISVTDELEFIKKVKADVVMEVTGTVAYGTEIALTALNAKKHLVTMNPELQATVGHELKKIADKKGLVITDVLGDQPGSLTRLIAQAKLMGFEVVVAGNMKRFMNTKATQAQMQKWADDKGLNVRQTTSFTDGTKQSIEMNLVANYFNMKVGKRGMTGTQVEELKDLLTKYDFSKLPKSGVVDYAIGLNLFPGIFILAKHKDPNQINYLKYLSLGEGPYYLLFEPYHLCHLEVAQTIAMVVLYKMQTINNSTLSTQTVAVAKRNLKKGELLDGIGGDMTYGEIDNATASIYLLPIGLSEKAMVQRDIKQGESIKMKDVKLDVNAATMLLGLAHAPKKGFFDFSVTFPRILPSYR